MIRHIHSNTERVGAPLAVALNQDGGKPRPYNVGILSYTVTKYKDLLVFSVSAHPHDNKLIVILFCC